MHLLPELRHLIAERALVPELIQNDMTAAAIARHVEPLLDADGDAARRMRAGLGDVRSKLGGAGASGRAAEAVLSHVKR